MIVLLGFLTGFVQIKLTGLEILVSFTNSNLVEFCFGYSALFCHFFSNEQLRVVLDAYDNTPCSQSNLRDSVGSGLLISVLGKLTLFHLIV